MKNRTVGVLVIGIALLIGFIIWAFNRAMTQIVNTACSHGPACPMWGTLNFQTYVSVGIMVFVAAIGGYLIIFTPEPTHPQAQRRPAPKPEDYKDELAAMGDDDRRLLMLVIDAKGSLFQSDLVAKTGFSKVKTTRILDRLEGKGLIERKRRGMTNVVLLRH
ncbi:MarR family transcriptional regulator [Candidatus Woesearchaeota archaeon]|nr:MarR family transcriptional regulator [Candidatus Woesearchaeota archaeon]